MARIAFFVESLPPAGALTAQMGWDLIRSLADQQHEIKVLSTFREGAQLPESHPRIEILRPFRSWRFSELVRLMPMLFEFRPEILHLIQPHQTRPAPLLHALDFIPGLAPLLGNPHTVVSYFDFEDVNLRRASVLLSAVDALTVANTKQLQFIQEQFRWTTPPPIDIVAAGSGQSNGSTARAPTGQEESGLHLAFQDLLARFPGVVVVPGPLDQHEDLGFTCDLIATCLKLFTECSVVISGGWGSLAKISKARIEERILEPSFGRRVLMTGPSSPDLMGTFFKHATCVLLAPLRDSSFALTEALQVLRQSAAPLILNDQQAQLSPVRWKNEGNALIRTKTLPELVEAIGFLLRSPEHQHHLRQNTAELIRTDLVDSPGNSISRLYVRLMSAY